MATNQERAASTVPNWEAALLEQSLSRRVQAAGQAYWGAGRSSPATCPAHRPHGRRPGPRIAPLRRPRGGSPDRDGEGGPPGSAVRRPPGLPGPARVAGGACRPGRWPLAGSGEHHYHQRQRRRPGQRLRDVPGPRRRGPGRSAQLPGGDAHHTCSGRPPGDRTGRC